MLAIIAAVALSPQPIADLPAKIVALHDAARAAIGSPPIQWDEKLVSDAEIWADSLAKSGKFEHDEQEAEGENLWMGTSGAYSIAEMIGFWSDERLLMPSLAKWEDDWERVGHYTQMVWADTRKVGCAIRTANGNDVLVCRYSPAGNVIGEMPNGAVGSDGARKAVPGGAATRKSGRSG